MSVMLNSEIVLLFYYYYSLKPMNFYWDCKATLWSSRMSELFGPMVLLLYSNCLDAFCDGVTTYLTILEFASWYAISTPIQGFGLLNFIATLSCDLNGRILFICAHYFLSVRRAPRMSHGVWARIDCFSTATNRNCQVLYHTWSGGLITSLTWPDRYSDQNCFGKISPKQISVKTGNCLKFSPFHLNRFQSKDKLLDPIAPFIDSNARTKLDYSSCAQIINSQYSK